MSDSTVQFLSVLSVTLQLHVYLMMSSTPACDSTGLSCADKNTTVISNPAGSITTSSSLQAEEATLKVLPFSSLLQFD